MNITPPYNFNSSIEILANFQIKFPRYDEGGDRNHETSTGDTGFLFLI